MSIVKVGIFFGGPSREREISFAGGRTVYDNLNKSVFEPIPIFVDSNKKLILLDWKNIYKGSIRDFYPPVSKLPESPSQFQVYLESLGELDGDTYTQIIEEVGTEINWGDLHHLIDVAFLALHGLFGEDGQIQGLLETLNIPYTGSDIFPCATGMNKGLQKRLMSNAGFETPEFLVIKKHQWSNDTAIDWFQKTKDKIGLPFVIRPANQGSSIGVAILKEHKFDEFKKNIDYGFFRQEIKSNEWNEFNQSDKIQWVRQIGDLRDGLGFPMFHETKKLIHPEELLDYLNNTFGLDPSKEKSIELVSHHSESEVIVEAFIKGKEFSCIVMRNENGESIALPPTEIIKGDEVFDYRSKYLPGLSRKVTPIDLEEKLITAIQKECERLFETLNFKVYARIDGFIQADGKIILNDPNTTSGMLPSSFFFHQAAEIGLNPSQFLSYIVRTSIQERIESSTILNHYPSLLQNIDHNINALQADDKSRKNVAVILGGYSFERHISVESGRNIYEKLASSSKYNPIPIFLMKDGDHHKLYQIPISLLLKDNADDIKDKILNFKVHPTTIEVKSKCASIINKYISGNQVFEPKLLNYNELKSMVDCAFIALHGRPGEDGSIQKELKAVGIPFNGSDSQSSQLTIDKYQTLQTLKAHGFEVTDQSLINKNEFNENGSQVLDQIESRFEYPLIAKPVDDGCSSAVQKIKNRAALNAFLTTIFRDEIKPPDIAHEILGINEKDEFPQKEQALIESLIDKGDAHQFMEITGGLLTHYRDGQLEYEIFEPSEALSSGEILSLEEKFLAGEGQNLTPSRFGSNKQEYEVIAKQVKHDLQKAAEILGITGYARIDAFVKIDQNLKATTIIIEANSLPGMTPATCIFHQCAINEYKPYDFIDKILEFACHEQA